MSHLHRHNSPALLGRWHFRYAPAVLLWGVIALGPIVVLIFDLVLSSFNTTDLQVSVFSLRSTLLLLKSVMIAGSVSICAMVFAITLVRITQEANFRFMRRLLWLSLALLLVPPYIHATAWITFGDKIVAGLGGIGLQIRGLSNVAGVIWIQIMAFFPLSLAFAIAAYRMTDQHQIDAARVFSPDWAVFRSIELPQILPAASIGAAVVFIMSITDFSVPSLMLVEVYALEAFVEYSMASNSLSSFIIALPLLVIGVVIILVMIAPLKKLGISTIFSQPHPARLHRPKLSTLYILGILACVFCVLQFMVPIIMLTVDAFPVSDLLVIIGNNTEVIFNSVASAAIAAAVSVLLAAGLLPMLKTWQMLPFVLIPLAVPASLIGIGLIRLWTLPGLDLFYNTAAMPILAPTARFSPVAILALYIQSRRYDPILTDVALQFRGNGPAVWFRVLLPLWLPGFAIGFFAVFGLALSELTANLLVSAPGQQMLTVKIFSLLHYGASQQVAILCLLVLAMSMMSMGAVFIAALTMKKLSRG